MSEQIIKTTEGTLTLLRTSDYDIRSIDEERERIIDAARRAASDIRAEATEILTQARQILVEARAEAAALRERACEGADEEGYARGMERGLAEGRNTGIEQFAQTVETEQAGLLETLNQLRTGMEEQREIILSRARRDLIRLAAAIAKIVCTAEVRVHERIAEGNVAKAMALAVKRSDLELRVNPGDLERIKSYVPKLARDLALPGRVTVLDDPHVGPGGCVVRHDCGAIDARIETQLTEIERQLLGSEGDDNG